MSTDWKFATPNGNATHAAGKTASEGSWFKPASVIGRASSVASSSDASLLPFQVCAAVATDVRPAARGVGLSQHRECRAAARVTAGPTLPRD